MTQHALRGYREREHTADWALDVWAPDLPALFQCAAEGMTALMGVRLADLPSGERVLSVQAPDPESLLVRFLSELLYYGESHGLGFQQIQIEIQPTAEGELRLEAVGQADDILSQSKEIKAVTFHNLKLVKTGQQWTATIVFDV